MLICCHICEAAQPAYLLLIALLLFSIFINLGIKELNEIDIGPHDKAVKVVPIEV